jgi:2-polyprenyl-3-methyl-5-hydroxy-6-metoxy-1,4-benzoquinol methylase
MNIKSIYIMIKNRVSRDEIYNTPNYWNSKAEAYSGQAISMWPNNILNSYYSSEQHLIIKKYLYDFKDHLVLDAGCGTGRLSRYLASQGAIVEGVDFSEKSIQEARKQSPGNNPTYKVQSIFDLNDTDRFDIVITCASVTLACKNNSEVFDVLTRLYRALKPQGKILLMEPVHKGFLHRVLNINLKDFCKIMTEAKFEIKDITHLHFWPMRLLLAYINWPRFITVSGYYIGEWILRLMRHKAFGDYVAILATPKRKR